MTVSGLSLSYESHNSHKTQWNTPQEGPQLWTKTLEERMNFGIPNVLDSRKAI